MGQQELHEVWQWQALDPVFKWSHPTDQDRLGLSGSSAGKNLEPREDRSYKGSALHPCLREDQPHTGLPWQRHCQLVKERDYFPHLWVTMSSFGPPEQCIFWQIEGAPRGFGVWSLWCAGRGWKSSFCLDWEEKAEKGLAAVLHYLERDYREDAWSHFSDVNKR